MQESEVHELRARVVELKAELSALRREHDALTALVDRIVVLLKTEHGEESVLLDAVEQAATDAITP
jgi:hypothetical protein